VELDIRISAESRLCIFDFLHDIIRTRHRPVDDELMKKSNKFDEKTERLTHLILAKGGWQSPLAVKLDLDMALAESRKQRLQINRELFGRNPDREAK
jgi:hypothetical protein